jgi:hypothetical protein
MQDDGERHEMAKDIQKAEVVSRTAACACGALKVTVSGAPTWVHACSCLECQRRSGSAFSYSAFFPESATSIEGEYRSWRRASFGGWHESSFCLTCGSWVFSRLEVLPNIVGISAGCFADPAFERPAKFYWSSQRHHWLSLPKEIEAIDSQ